MRGDGTLLPSLDVMISPTPAAAKGDFTRGTLDLTFGAALEGRLGDCCVAVVIEVGFVIVPGIARSEKLLELVGEVVCIGMAMQFADRLSQTSLLSPYSGIKSATREVCFPPLLGACQIEMSCCKLGIGMFALHGPLLDNRRRMNTEGYRFVMPIGSTKKQSNSGQDIDTNRVETVDDGSVQ